MAREAERQAELQRDFLTSAAVLVAVNLQTAFLSPPMAMSAYYLKGIAPAHVRISDIFRGMMPYMLIVILCMVLIYIFPQIVYWLPNLIYG